MIWPARDNHIPAEELRKAPRDCKAEASSLGRARGVLLDLPEWVKDSVDVVCRDTDPAIIDIECHAPRLFADAKRHDTNVGELDSVRQAGREEPG